MISVAWTKDRIEYETLFGSVIHSTLLQSWAWGEAKRICEGWIPRRGIIRENEKPVAIVQILEKRFGPLRIARLNRGPLWLSGNDWPTQAAVMTHLRESYRWWAGRLLLTAPELPEEQGESLVKLGFHPRAGGKWGSAWLDLGLDEATLRKGLHGKWRNMLVNAENRNLKSDLLSGKDGVEWLTPHYQAMMDARSFSGIAPAVLRCLVDTTGAADDMLVVRALLDGVPVSAALLARHGAAATYLVGWTDDAGRQNKANYFVLWRAMDELRARGCRAFDLGGIDAEATPGIASFKRGMKGQEYRLAGEYLSL